MKVIKITNVALETFSHAKILKRHIQTIYASQKYDVENPNTKQLICNTLLYAKTITYLLQIRHDFVYRDLNLVFVFYSHRLNMSQCHLVQSISFTGFSLDY